MAGDGANVPELRFPEFEGEWSQNSMKSLAAQKGLQTGPFGSQLKASEYTNEDNGTPVVMPKDISSGHIKNNSISRVTQKKALQVSKHRISEGDILFPRRGELGRIALVRKAQAGWLCGTGCLRLRLAGNTNPNFIYTRLQRHEVLQWLEDNAVGQTMLNLNTEIIGGLKIFVPTLPEQQIIAAFLGAVDGKIGQLEKKKALLEDYKKGCMQQLFSRTLRFKDDNGNDFPEWEEKRLGEVATCLDSRRVPLNSSEREQRSGPYPYYGANGCQGYIDGYLFDEPITLLAEDGGNFDEFQTRPIAQFVANKCWVNNHAHVLSANDEILDDRYLYQSLVHKDIRAFVNGSSRAKLNQADMLKIPLEIPHPAEQQKIANFLTAIDDKITLTTTQLTQAQTFKKGLLQQMFV